MLQAPQLFITVDEFRAQYGDCDRYKLIDGELIEMEPTEPHVCLASLQEKQVAGFVGVV